LDVIYERCCALEVHKRTVVACLIVAGTHGEPRKEIRTFGTMTEDLLELSDWLAAAGCTHVAMESTAVYWKPIYNLLEEAFTPLLINARHIKAVPGRKTAVKDCEWIAELLKHGLLRGSFVPERSQRELRKLTRYRTALVRERAAEVSRLHKTLEGANIKLASVATDIMGKSGRQMLKALIAGSTDASEMAQLARGKLRAKIPQLEHALSPTVTLTITALRSVGWSTVRVPNIGHFQAILGSKKGISGLVNGSLGLKCHCRTKHCFHGFGVARQGPWNTWVNSGRKKDQST
jgi:transposase